MRKKTIKENQYWDTNPDAEISLRGFQNIVKSEKENMLVRNKNIENFREKKKNPKQKMNQSEIQGLKNTWSKKIEETEGRNRQF